MLRRVVAGAALLLAFGSGCVSVSHVQTADTLGRGKFQFGIEPGVGGAAVISDEEGSDSIYYPHVDLSMRYGVSDSVDLGVRFGSSLVELQSKFLLTDSRNPNMAVSLAPSVSGVFLGTSTTDDDITDLSYVNVALPLLVGFKTSGGSELVLGPRITGTRLSGRSLEDSAAVNILSVGASVGYALRVTQGFRLMPEVGVSVPVLGEVNTSSTESEMASGFGAGFVQVKLGFLFGGGRPINRGADIDVDDIDHDTDDSGDEARYDD